MVSSEAMLIALSAIVGGTLVTYVYDENLPVALRVCAGACIGFTGLGLIGFIYASVFGLTSLILSLTTLTALSPLLLLARQRLRAQVHAEIELTACRVHHAVFGLDRRGITYFLFYVISAVLLWCYFTNVMFERQDGIFTSIGNNVGDLPFHLSVITSFVRGANFPPEHPDFAGARLTYPFLSDFIAAIFVRAGADLQGALFLENLVLTLALVGLLYYWALKLTRDTVAALITPSLILLSGGLGWMSAAKDLLKSSNGVFATLMHLPRDYTVMWDGAYRWGNILNMVAIQRSLLLGVSLSIIVWTLWWRAIRNEADHPSADMPPKRRAWSKSLQLKHMIAAGAVAGLLPLAHSYSFIVMIGMGACLALLFRQWLAWTTFFVVALMIAAPQLLFLSHNSALHAANFFGWHWGLYLTGNNFVWFWILNTGLSIPLLVIAALWRGRTPTISNPLLRFYLPFTLCFIVPNLIRLAPWRWDNLKVMVYWYIASAPLIAMLLAKLWRANSLIRLAVPALFSSLILAGSLDVWRVISNVSENKVYDQEIIAFAGMIVKSTPPRALILHVPNLNHAVFLTGRRSLIGPYLFSHGIDYASRAADFQRIYAGAADADALIQHYKIDYIVIEPLEPATLPLETPSLAINEFFFEKYPLIAQMGKYRLYETGRLKSSRSF
jgi:hypothetical protein